MKVPGHFCFVLLLGVLILSSGCLDDQLGKTSKKLGDGHDFGDNDPNVVLCMGDSITRGGYSGGAPWPARFGQMIGKSAINDGLSGTQASAGSARIRGRLTQYKPGFVIIFYGANDAIKQVDIGITESSIRKMVAAAKENQSIPVLATVLPQSGNREIYNGAADLINQRIRQIAGEEKVKLVRLDRAVGSNPSKYYVDNLHLNDLGEQLVAMEFYDAFR